MSTVSLNADSARGASAENPAEGDDVPTIPLGLPAGEAGGGGEELEESLDAAALQRARDDARHPARSLNDLADSRPPHLTIVVPTRNEAQNVEPLLQRLAAASGSLPTEVLFVDDSDDDTAEVIAGQAATCAVGLRLIHRPQGERRGGLSGAVVSAVPHAANSAVVARRARRVIRI